MSLLELLPREPLPYGDSPTVKSYLDWPLWRATLEELLREGDFELSTSWKPEGGVEPSGASAVKIVGSHALSSLHRALGAEAAEFAFDGGKGALEFPSVASGLAVANLVIKIRGDGELFIMINPGDENRAVFAGINLFVDSGARPNILIDVEPRGDALAYVNVVLSSGEGSSANLVTLAAPKSSCKVDVEMAPGPGSQLISKFVGLVREGANAEAVLDSVVHGDLVDLLVNGAAVFMKNSTGAMRGRGVIAHGSRNAKLVYGFDALLEEGARAYLQPFLEVNTNAVREARHYARNYLLTEDKLFYLMSRGLEPWEARKLMITGFLLSSVPEPLREFVERRAEGFVARLSF